MRANRPFCNHLPNSGGGSFFCTGFHPGPVRSLPGERDIFQFPMRCGLIGIELSQRYFELPIHGMSVEEHLTFAPDQHDSGNGVDQ